MTSDGTAGLEKGVVGTTAERPYDLLGIGFGPSNLALAVCAYEQQSPLSCLFVERSDGVAWHPGMLIEGARMQISFLKDLVSLRNPASPYTFLQYAKAKGRLERFVNLNESRLTRIEYNDYLRWVAEDFAEQVRYGTRVERVTPVRALGGRELSLFRVETEDVASGLRTTVYARNVVHAGGGRPDMSTVAGAEAPAVMHSSEFLTRFPARFDDTRRSYRFVVVGGGQSAGEIAEYILDRYEHADVHLVVNGLTLQPTDNSPFSNEQYYSENAEAFYRLTAADRAVVAAQVRNSNYGVIREDLLDRLYRTDYLDHVKGRRRLHIRPFSRLSAVREQDEALVATIGRRLGDQPEDQLRCDGVVLATGYDRSLDPEMFGDVLPFLATEEGGAISLSRSYRAHAQDVLRAGLYLQGFGEAHFGIGDTLLSLLPFRSQDILNDITGRRPAPAVNGCPVLSARGTAAAAAYPPRWYLEDDPEKLYGLMERFPFATLISACADGEPVATHLPLTLDRTRGPMGVLFGHLDRANRHARLLDGRRMLVVFHGPNAYMPPSVFESDPLPTWNSMAVHVRGAVRVVEDQNAVVRGLIGIAEHSEPASGLRRDDPRIDRLIGGIVGFELDIDELTGRFKLSQDRDETDRRLAAVALARATERGDRDFIEYAVGLSLITEDDPRAPAGRQPFPIAIGGVHE